MNHYLVSFLHKQRKLYLFYVLISGLFLFTFYLYDLDLTAYFDGLLFTSFLLVVDFVIAYPKYVKTQKQLAFLATRPLYQHAHLTLPVAINDTEKAYQLLVTNLLAQKEAQTETYMKAQKNLLDDFGLWLHQIKTPLAALDLITQTNRHPDPVAIKSELVQVNDYLQMMLSYLRQNFNHEDLVIKTLPLAPLIKAVVKKYALFFSKKDIQLTLENLDQKVISDAKWLTFILEQIIFNALKYTHHGKLTIRFTNQQLIISDTGIGIRPEDVPRVFEKGYTGYNGREYQRASGLGLYLSKTAATRIGIHLVLTSTLGKGTTLTLTFPKQLTHEPTAFK